MATVTLADIRAFLEERFHDCGVQYDLDDVENRLPQLHNDHLFEALTNTEPDGAPEHLQAEFEERDDVYTATELVVEYVNRTFTAEVRETLPRAVLDSFIQCSARVLEDEIDGVYADEGRDTLSETSEA